MVGKPYNRWGPAYKRLSLSIGGEASRVRRVSMSIVDQPIPGADTYSAPRPAISTSLRCAVACIAVHLQSEIGPLVFPGLDKLESGEGRIQ